MNLDHSGPVVEYLLETEGLQVLTSPVSLRLCPWARNINPCLVLVQPRKTHPYISENLLTGA